MNDGTIILSPAGETITHDRTFYAAFIGSEDFSIRYKDETIGNLPSKSLPPQGEHFILNGRRWLVCEIESSSRIAQVEPSRSRKVSVFMGASGQIHTKIMLTIQHILESDHAYSYLHTNAEKLLTKARALYRNANLHENCYTSQLGKTTLYPWVGTKSLLTFALCAKLSGIPCEIKKMSLVYHLSPKELKAHLKTIADNKYSPIALANLLPDKHLEKYDEYAPPDLLNQINTKRSFNLKQVCLIAEELHSSMIDWN